MYRESFVNAVSVLMLVLVSIALAGPWDQKLGFELLLNEGYYSSNWQGDERTSGSASATFSHLAQNQVASRLRFEHDLALAFGQQVQQDTGPDEEFQVSKSEDRIKLDDILRFTLGAWVDPLINVQVKSQFLDLREEQTRYVNPLLVLEMAGVGRKFYDDSTRTLLSQVGFAARQSFDAAAETTLVSDAGIGWTSTFRTRVFSPNATYSSKLGLYKALLALGGSDEVSGLPTVDWEHELTARFSKAISGKVYVQLLFDEGIVDALRLKQTMGLGLSLTWQSAKPSGK